MIRFVIAASLAAAAVSSAQGQEAPERPQITVFEHPDFQGRSATLDGDAPDLRWIGFNDQISSIRIEGGQWEVCLEPDYQGTCQVLDQSLPDMSAWAFNDRITSIQAVHPAVLDDRIGVTLYEGRDYTGRSVSIVREEDGLGRYEFDDRANSIEVHSGVWTLCENSGFGGRCVEIDRDSNDLQRFRMDDRLSALTPRALQRQETSFGAGYQPGDGFQTGFGGDIDIGGAIPGVGVMFYGEPHVNRIPIAACSDRRERRCGRDAADLMCRQAGFDRSAYHGVQRIQPRSAYRLSDQSPARTREILVDVLCVQ